MDDRSSAVPDADCGAARGTSGRRGEKRQEAGTLCEGERATPVSRHRPESGQERSAIVARGNRPDKLLARSPPSSLPAARPWRAPDKAGVVVGSKRFTESYILGEIVPRRWSLPAGRGARAGSGQHRHPRAGARQRGGRRLSRVHRHDRARAAQARGQSVARGAQPLAGAARPEGGGAAAASTTPMRWR